MIKSILPMFALAYFSVSVSAQQKTPFVPCNETPELMQNYYADVRALDRVYIVEGSPEFRERYKMLAQNYLDQLRALPFDRLPQGCKADYILFQRDLGDVIYKADEEAGEYNQLKAWLPFADSIYALEKVRRRGGALDGQKVAANFSAVAKQLKILNAKAEADKNIGVKEARRAKIIIAGMQAAAKNVFNFYNAYDPNFSWWVPDTYKKLDEALSDYSAVFKKTADKNSPKKDSSGIVGFPIGREELLRELKIDLIPYSPEELTDIASREMAWCDREMIKASTDMGFGADWKKALEKVKQSYVPAGEQPQAMMKIYDESVAFIKSRDMITIPPLAEETWRIVMMSPKQQLVNPFFYGGEEFAVSYPTNTMDFDDRMMSMRGNNPHFARAAVHHELIAGHYLEQFMNDHYHAYRHFPTAFWTEGWSLYWEMLLWDEGFAQTPEDRVGMLFWRMHRCARIIFSLNYHLGKWSPQECVDFLVDRVGHERANAEGEVRRSFSGGYNPLYQAGYMIGGLQIMALKNEMLGGGKTTLKQFHDAVMRQNAMPIEMLRNILTNRPMQADYRPQWRFYQAKP